MAKPTVFNTEDSSRAAYERQKINDYNHHLKIQPHLYSHVHVQIRANNVIPSHNKFHFLHNIYVRIIGTAEFCSQVKCFAYLPRGKSCTKDSEPTIFKSGNSDIHACQSSCFNLYDGAKDEEGNLFKGPLTHYSDKQRCCMYHSDYGYRLGVDDYMRTDNHPTKRIDTIGTGFDLSSQLHTDDQGNETFQFKLNKYYCDDFKYEFHGNQCKPSLGETIIGILASENLYKGIQYGVRKITDGVGISDVATPKLPAITSKPKTFNEWISNVNENAHFFNPNLTLEDLGITEDTRHLIFTTEYGWPGRLVEPLLVYQSPSTNHQTVSFAYGKDLLPQFRIDQHGRREFDEYELLGVYEMLARLNKQMHDALPVDGEVDQNKVRAFFENLGEQFTTWEFYAQVGTIFLNEFATIMKGLLSYAEKAFEKAAKIMVSIAQKTIFQHLALGIGINSLSMGARVFKMLASSLKMASVVGMIFDVLGLVDLVLIGKDLFGTNNLGDQSFVDGYSRIDFLALEEAFGYKSVEFSPALYITLYNSHIKDKPNTPAENLVFLNKNTSPYATTVDMVVEENQMLDMFKWQTEYLLNLERNSDGIPIDWSEKIDLKEFNDMVDGRFNKAPTTYENYNEYILDLRKRKDVILWVYIGAIGLSFGSIMTKSIIMVIFTLLTLVFVFTYTMTPS